MARRLLAALLICAAVLPVACWAAEGETPAGETPAAVEEVAAGEGVLEYLQCVTFILAVGTLYLVLHASLDSGKSQKF